MGSSVSDPTSSSWRECKNSGPNNVDSIRLLVCEIDFRDQGANLGRRICDLVEHFKTVAQARWLSGFRQYYTYASELMGLGGGAEISQHRVRFSRDLLMMNVMFETSVLSVN